jgi:hypothetical protein
MTEAEWLACDEPSAILRFLADRRMRRKLRLIGCACCRKVWPLLADAESRTAVEVAERFADGQASEQDRRAAVHAVRQSASRLMSPEERRVYFSWGAPPGSNAARAALAAHAVAYSDDAEQEVASEPLSLTRMIQSGGGIPRRDKAVAAWIQSFIGNPFSPVSFSSSLRTTAFISLAHAAYDERDLASGHLDPARLAVLSDALEDAGCTDEALLSHLRSPGPHVRGCWALDLVLGKE